VPGFQTRECIVNRNGFGPAADQLVIPAWNFVPKPILQGLLVAFKHLEACIDDLTGILEAARLDLFSDETLCVFAQRDVLHPCPRFQDSADYTTFHTAETVISIPLDKQSIPAQKVVMMITCTTTAATYFWAYL
jgi:hypothetical protein